MKIANRGPEVSDRHHHLVVKTTRVLAVERQMDEDAETIVQQKAEIRRLRDIIHRLDTPALMSALERKVAVRDRIITALVRALTTQPEDGTA